MSCVSFVHKGNFIQNKHVLLDPREWILVKQGLLMARLCGEVSSSLVDVVFVLFLMLHSE